MFQFTLEERIGDQISDILNHAILDLKHYCREAVGDGFDEVGHTKLDSKAVARPIMF